MGLIRRGGGASDFADVLKTTEILTSDYVETELKSAIIRFDASAGALNCTLVDPSTVKPNTLKRISNTSSNYVLITNTILGEETPYIDSARASLSVISDGTNWIRFDEDQNQFEIDRITNTLKTKSPFTFQANQLKGGSEADTVNSAYDDFTNLDSNIESDGTSHGNLLIDGTNLNDQWVTVTRDAGVDPVGGTNEVLRDGTVSGNQYMDWRGSWGSWVAFDFGEGNEQSFNRLKMNFFSVLDHIPDSVQIETSDDGVYFGDNQVIDTTNATAGSDLFTYDIDQITSKRHFRMTCFGTGNEGLIRELQLFNASFASVSNYIQSNLTESNITVSMVKAYNENDILISDETLVLIEYTTDGGSNWSTQETLASFNASDNIVSTGVFNYRLAPVGATRISRSESLGPSTFLNVSNSGFTYEIDGQEEFSFTKENGVSVGGASLNSRLDTIENNPTSEVADITARDALTPALDEIVKVTDAGGAETKVYKWDGSQWNDITSLSNSNLNDVQDRISALENNPTSEVADITARDALTPALNEIVQVLDDGGGNVAIYKWNGSSWDDITNISGGPALSIANQAQADANQALADSDVTCELYTDQYQPSVLNTLEPEFNMLFGDDDDASKTHELTINVTLRSNAQTPSNLTRSDIQLVLFHDKNEALGNYKILYNGEVFEITNTSDVHYSTYSRRIRGATDRWLDSYFDLVIIDNTTFSPARDYNVNDIAVRLLRESGQFSFYVKTDCDNSTTDTSCVIDVMLKYWG